MTNECAITTAGVCCKAFMRGVTVLDSQVTTDELGQQKLK